MAKKGFEMAETQLGSPLTSAPEILNMQLDSQLKQ